MDSIVDLSKIAGLEEILRSILLVPSLNADTLLEVLQEYQNGYLYQKCGLIFEALNDVLGLPPSFFEKCQAKIPSTRRYLTQGEANQIYYPKWNLYAHKDIKSIIAKGGGALMMQYDRITLGRQAKELNFVRDVFEKVRRLEGVLEILKGMTCLRIALH